MQTRREFMTLIGAAAIVAIASYAQAAECSFLDTGQSNAVGRAPVQGRVPTAMPHRISMLTLGNRLLIAADPTHSTSARYGNSAYPNIWPAAPDPQRNIQGGAVVEFADWLADRNKSDRYTIIPNAKGGTRIIYHMPGKPIFNAAVDRVRLVGRPLCAIIFIQGESDAKQATDANMWLERFGVLVHAWRRKFGSGVPVILVRLSAVNPDPTTFPRWMTVRNQQDKAATSISNIILVSSDGAPKQAGGSPHYTGRGYKVLAARMGQAFMDWKLK